MKTGQSQRAVHGDLILKTRAAAEKRHGVRLKELTALVRRRLSAIVESFYDIGEALVEIQAKKLYSAAGYANMQAYLAGEALMSPRQAYKLIAVVKRVPRDLAMKLGREKAYALVMYTDATPEADTVTAIIRSDVRVGKARARAASVRDIVEATRVVQSQKEAARPVSAKEKAKAKHAANVERAVRAALRTSGLGKAEITVKRERVEVVIPIAHAERLIG
jgi:hypothetical protein